MFRPDGRRVILEDEPEYPLLPLDEIATGDVQIQTEVNLVRIGGVTFLMVPGELYPELWLDGADGHNRAERSLEADYPLAPRLTSFCSEITGEHARILVNQANDAIGYILPRSQWDRLPPYVYGEAQYGEGVSLGSHVSEDVHAAVRSLASDGG